MNNEISDQGLQSFSDGVRRNESITSLELDRDWIEDHSIKTLGEVATHARSNISGQETARCNADSVWNRGTLCSATTLLTYTTQDHLFLFVHLRCSAYPVCLQRFGCSSPFHNIRLIYKLAIHGDSEATTSLECAKPSEYGGLFLDLGAKDVSDGEISVDCVKAFTPLAG